MSHHLPRVIKERRFIGSFALRSHELSGAITKAPGLAQSLTQDLSQEPIPQPSHTHIADLSLSISILTAQGILSSQESKQ